ncbi:MAG TPA: serine/threonine protein phosphatase, partial [Flavobacteriales bacterium]|nr:serine/threonine protein phosphatase [Flavobacteriales bacterium]
DGFADQFGGEKGKKLKYKPFKNLLHSTADKPLIEQEKELEKFLSDWMKNYEQTDDITLIGIEIT